MVQGIIIWLVTLLLTYVILGVLKQKHPVLNRRFMILLFLYHTLLAITYYIYALFNPSDSKMYFSKAVAKAYGDDWFGYFGISTKFIDFISFFLVNKLGFTYESEMALFSWFGFLGFVFFYIFLKERIQSPVKIFGFDAILILLLLPNLHFWSSSLGKGSLIFCGFGLFFYALKSIGPRFWAILLGGWIIFQIRPHVFYVILIAIALSYTFSTKGVGIGYRVLILGAAVFLLFFIYEDILSLTGLEDDSMLDPLISHRASELTKATSGINIMSYSLPEKMFAFWFRPLFFDAPGALGFIISFENLFYLFFIFRLLRPSGIRFLLSSDAIVKTSFLTFFGVSFALAQISGNLGLAMRQKSQVMVLMLFVVLKYMDEQKMIQLKNAWARRRTLQRMKPEIIQQPSE